MERVPSEPSFPPFDCRDRGLSLANSALCRGLNAARRRGWLPASLGVGAELAELADDSILFAVIGCLPLLFDDGSAGFLSCWLFSLSKRASPAPEAALLRDCSICVSRSVALGSSIPLPDVAVAFAKGKNVGEESSSSSSSSSTLLNCGFLCWNGGGRRNIWLRCIGPASESDVDEELELEAGDEGEVVVSVVAARGAVSSLREGGGWEFRNERWTAARGDGGGRKH